MESVMKWLNALWPFALVLGLLAMFIWLIAKFVGVLVTLDSIVLAAVIAVGGAVITAITAILVKKVEKKHEVEAQFRENKVELFNSLLVEFDKLFDESKDNPLEMVEFLKGFQRKLLFWAGPKVMKEYLALRTGTGKIETIDDTARSLQLMGTLILAMRKDLGLSNSGLNAQTFGATLILRHAGVFLEHHRKTPTMTSDEFSEIEEVLNQQLTDSE